MLTLRFIEIRDGEIRQQEINRYPCVIGRKGTVIPLISNGALSQQHCTINFNFKEQVWTVIDGTQEQKSSNGIYRYDRKTLEIERAHKQISIINEGDRVYLLNKIDGTCAYVELSKGSLDCPTQDFDPALVELNAGLQEVAERSILNQGKIGEIEGAVKRISDSVAVMQWVGAKPLQTLIGLLILLFAGFGLISLTILYTKGPDVIDAVLQSKGYKIERK
jgi:FHA domain